ncbi:trichohyalin-like [Penaeus japonicus]|uniref:trichohyalin-like n=1 Tax=Penaeus japonicus TaxID=27405 RepID=UPI001C7117D8|nr:trichohyalin-like [Penaeus japonicus]XP_042892833.1 trichohyalin-like [Penaeus japonicus]XP_042892834.1 trichohyalin-like [Penaeus japonicus]XP_042892835.1 trichohyalin-like [Penaeus japonicus]XP_042892837.1 trichohyalin-like [Penaeus japonicus]
MAEEATRPGTGINTASLEYINRKKASVIRVVEQLQVDAHESCSQTPVPFLTCKTTSAEDRAESALLDMLAEFQKLIHHRLYFSPRLEYLYATQMAALIGRVSNSGESVSRLENCLLEMQTRREENLRTRTDIIQSLRKRLEELNADEEDMVNTCRTALREEYDEVRESSRVTLDELKTDLEKNISAMVAHGARHEESELQLRMKRQDLEDQIMLQIRKYDATMSSLQTTLDSLRAEDSHVTLMLEKKQLDFEEMEKRFQEIEAEKQRKEEERMAAMQREFRREHAARTIQRAWQHFKMRKMLKKAQKKRKKKSKDVK